MKENRHEWLSEGLFRCHVAFGDLRLVLFLSFRFLCF